MERVVSRGPGPVRPCPVTPPHVGHFYLNAQGRLYCLNDTARELVREGVPVLGDEQVQATLYLPEGGQVSPTELPVGRAWREREPCEGTFLLAMPGTPTRCLTWSAAPLVGPRNELVGVTATAVLSPPEPDWEELAGLAHDIRTPLQSLRLLVPVLETAVAPSAPQDAIRRIRGAADRALALGQELVEWCRAPLQGGDREKGGWTALSPLLEGLTAEQHPLAMRKALRFELELGPAPSLEVQAHAGRLGRLMSNLITNAIRYTASGRVAVIVSWRDTGGPNQRWLVLSVEDTGVGMSSEEQESIFLSFHRGRAGRADSDSGGSGLGLNVVDRLVRDLDLTLEIHSEPGRGTRFDLLVPSDRVRLGP